MDLGIAGQVAFVAGGSKGIARPVSSLLAADGAKVAVVARDQAAIDKTVSEIEADGGTVIGISADLSSQAGIDAAVAEVTDRWGSPDICLAQISASDLESFGAFFDVPVEAYGKAFEHIVVSYVRLMHAVLPQMRRKGWGRYVHLGSVGASEPAMEFPNVIHNTVQSSVVTFLKSMSDEFAKDGVTFNSVGPGWTRTDTLEGIFRRQGIEPEAMEPFLLQTQRIPIGRLGRPEETASMITYLCSDLASYCTGNHYLVDGSMHRAAF